jgi:hypothetical protein
MCELALKGEKHIQAIPRARNHHVSICCMCDLTHRVFLRADKVLGGGANKITIIDTFRSRRDVINMSGLASCSKYNSDPRRIFRWFYWMGIQQKEYAIYLNFFLRRNVCLLKIQKSYL